MVVSRSSKSQGRRTAGEFLSPSFAERELERARCAAGVVLVQSAALAAAQEAENSWEALRSLHHSLLRLQAER